MHHQNNDIFKNEHQTDLSRLPRVSEAERAISTVTGYIIVKKAVARQRSGMAPMYRDRCFDERIIRCTSEVTPNRLMYNRAKSLIPSVFSLDEVITACDSFLSSLDSYTSNRLRHLGSLTS